MLESVTARSARCIASSIPDYDLLNSDRVAAPSARVAQRRLETPLARCASARCQVVAAEPWTDLTDDAKRAPLFSFIPLHPP